jgi:hypothetical protein
MDSTITFEQTLGIDLLPVGFQPFPRVMIDPKEFSLFKHTVAVNVQNQSITSRYPVFYWKCASYYIVKILIGRQFKLLPW